MERNDVYEPPRMVEAGEFAELTRGVPQGNWPDYSVMWPWYPSAGAQG
ncbi:lasso RiPP family leader peptide-containing protein [Streptomyces caatingaensis]|nr:lasso RiPP family leader peptide-containing protein [Streptomyces caatingaensis]